MDTTTLAAPPSAVARLDLYGPIAGDLEEVERLLLRSLKNRRPRVSGSAPTCRISIEMSTWPWSAPWPRPAWPRRVWPFFG